MSIRPLCDCARRPFRYVITIIMFGLMAPAPMSAQAPQDPQLAETLRALQTRLDLLEKQNQSLQETVRQLQDSPRQPTLTLEPVRQEAPVPAQDVRALVDKVLTEREHAKAQADAAAKEKAELEGTVVGTKLGFKGVWTTGPGATGYQPWFETEDKAYRFHIGGRIQPDYIFGAGADKTVQQGAGGTGPFNEGGNFRRARLEVDGWLHENIDYFVEFEFANGAVNTGVKPGLLTPAGTPTNTQSFTNIVNTPVPSDLWISVNNLPFIGIARVGNLKPAIGLDHLTSSRFLDFLERSSGFDTYYNRNNGWESGFLITNWTENKRATYQVTITRTANTPSGFNQGGNGWDYTGRLTWHPYYEDDGRYMVHLGLGAKYQGLDNSTGLGIANLNTRWLLRNSQANLQNVVALALLTGEDQTIINPEFFINIGPLSIQSEFIASQVNDVTSFATQLTPTAIKVSPRTFSSRSAYVQAMYFLTGEHRPFAQTALHGPGAAPTRVVPYRNFFWNSGEHGNVFSMGAWQVGARYCYTNLDDRGINGGIINELTFGLNWFLNPNLKFQWNYDLGHRELIGGTSDGNYYGFGMRMAFDF
jgi:phosphate-selective porin OprO/OprP